MHAYVYACRCVRVHKTILGVITTCQATLSHQQGRYLLQQTSSSVFFQEDSYETIQNNSLANRLMLIGSISISFHFNPQYNMRMSYFTLQFRQSSETDTMQVHPSGNCTVKILHGATGFSRKVQNLCSFSLVCFFFLTVIICSFFVSKAHGH